MVDRKNTVKANIHTTFKVKLSGQLRNLGLITQGDHPMNQRSKILRTFLCAALTIIGVQSVYAQNTNQAVVVRATDLKAQAASDAATLKVLPENSTVDVLSRKASWTEVRAQTTVGWVKMLSLRFGGKTESASSTDTVKGFFNLAKTGSSGSTVTTGARGFGKEKFTNPTPNPEALGKMKNFTISKTEAANFAKQEKLIEQKQNYVKASGDQS